MTFKLLKSLLFILCCCSIGQVEAQRILLQEDFEGGVIPEGWVTQNGGSEWVVSDNNEDPSWTPTPHTFYASIIDARIYNNEDTYLATPPLDLSEEQGTELRFAGLMRFFSGIAQQHSVQVSLDGRQTWIEIYRSVAIYNLNTWKEDYVLDLSQFDGEPSVTIAFHFTDFTHPAGDGFCVDDVLITSQNKNDAEVLFTPRLEFAGGEVYPTVEVRNNGYDPIHSFDLNVTIVDTATQVSIYNESVTITEEIPAFETSVIDFSTPWSTTAADVGGYRIAATITAPDDEDSDNDTYQRRLNLVDPEQNYATDKVYSFMRDRGDYNKSLVLVDKATGELDSLRFAGGPDIIAADFIDGYLYGVDTREHLWFIAADGTKYPVREYEFTSPPTNNSTAAVNFIMDGLAFDAARRETYFVVNRVQGSYIISGLFKTSDTRRWGIEFVTSLEQNRIFGIASSLSGDLYAIPASDNLLQFNQETVTWETVGPLGVNTGYLQDIGFDREADVLYSFMNGPARNMYTIDHTTGQATLLAERSEELPMCAVHYTSIGNAFLTDVSAIDGSLNTVFQSSDFEYTVVVPFGTTEAPALNYTPVQDNATVMVTEATGIPGTATVVVSVPEGHEATYTVHFVAEEKDISLVNVTPSVFVFEGEEVMPTVTLENIADAVIDDYTVTVSIVDASMNEVYNVSESFTDPIIAGQTLKLLLNTAWSAPVADESFTLTVSVVVNGGETDDTNNELTHTIAVIGEQSYEPGVVYGYARAQAGALENSIVTLNKYTGAIEGLNHVGEPDLNTGDFIGNRLYTINKTEQEVFFITDAGEKLYVTTLEGVNRIHGLTYDAASDKVYIIAFDETNTVLYTADENWELTEIGVVTEGRLFGIAANSNGELYGIAETESGFYSINTSTGEGTLIATLPVEILYAQDIGFDRNSGLLYATLNGPGKGFYTINTTNGELTTINLQSEVISVCAIAYEGITLSSDASLSNLSVNEGMLDPAFDPDVLTYTVSLPEGTAEVPVVNFTTNHPGATVVVTNATSLPGTATVVVTAEDGVTQTTYTVAFTLVVGLEEITGVDITVFPNPTKGVVNIKAEGNYQLLVMDALGKLVLEQEMTNAAIIDLKSVSAGIYFIQLKDGEKILTKHIVVE